MPVYTIIETEILDEGSYADYARQIRQLAERHRGRYLAVDTRTASVPLCGGQSSISLIEFPTHGDMTRCFSAEELPAIADVPQLGAPIRLLAVDGCPAAPAERDRRRHVVMFTDVHSFSILGVEIGAGFPQFVQAYYERMGDEITRRGGLIVKYIGDGLLALFDGGHEEDTVECAVAMRGAYERLVAQHNLKTETELEVGIASGEVLVGTFGHPSLVVRDVMGEAVYEAARLMHHRGVAVTGPVRKALIGKRAFRFLADITVKWASTPLQAWELVESRPEPA